LIACGSGRYRPFPVTARLPFPGEVVVVRRSSVTRRAPRKAIVGLLATCVSIALLPCGVAAADTVETNFEAPTFHLGTVNGQPFGLPSPPTAPGWKSATPFDIPSLPHGYDQAVVANSGAPSEFGGQSLRLSNAFGTGPETFPPEYHFQTYSQPTTEAAGESLANTEFTAQFSFISVHPDREQPGLKITVSPDNGEGGRMSYVGLTDASNGMIKVDFYDTNPKGEWVEYDLGTLPRDKPHTIKFWMRLIPGPNNDLVRISIDGRDVGECFTTWESSYPSVPISDRLLFLSGNRNGDIPSLLGGGYLFDNVAVTTGKGAGPPTCDLPIEKQADASTARPGGRVRYRITVHNRGRLSASNVLLCDQIPSEMTFVSANRKPLRFGSRRCLLIPHLAPGQRVSFHLVLRVDANAPPGDVDNIGEEIPGVEPPGIEPPGGKPPGSPPAPAPAAADLPPGAKTASVSPAKEAKAIVTVLAKRTARRPLIPPPVTG
jgi:uncharacterized repeat protein (TIGR01451 family)